MDEITIEHLRRIALVYGLLVSAGKKTPNKRISTVLSVEIKKILKEDLKWIVEKLDEQSEKSIKIDKPVSILSLGQTDIDLSSIYCVGPTHLQKDTRLKIYKIYFQHGLDLTVYEEDKQKNCYMSRAHLVQWWEALRNLDQ